MIEFYGAGFIGNLTLLLLREETVRLNLEAFGPLAEPTAEERKYLLRLIEEAKRGCEDIGLDGGAMAAGELHDRLSSKSYVCNWQLLQADLRHFFVFLGSDLAKQRFVFIPQRRHKYLEAEDRFELGSPPAFPSAAQEIRDAGNCLAVELYTATVFHLMRAAEIALRALAKERRVKIGKPARKLEWEDWQTIIREISSKVDVELRDWRKRGPNKDAFAAFYNGALGSFHQFKDVYRNHVMHVRKSYKERDAEEAMAEVEKFFRQLTPRLSESGKRIRWPR